MSASTADGVRVLLVDDDSTFRRALAGALRRRDHVVHVAPDAQEAFRVLEREEVEVALLDLKMPGMDGIDLMEEVLRQAPELQAVILTGHGTIPSAIEAIQRGAFHYLTKPCDVSDVELVLRNAAKQRALERENTRLKLAMKRAAPYEGMVGDSEPMRRLYEVIERTKESWSPVLVQGESGTGKELVARALHGSSSRSERPFVAVNCAGLNPEMLEHELFGYPEGAFGPGTPARAGLFEIADRGTLFIDEVADMDLRIQASLLRVVESGVFRPLGTTRELEVQVRVIAATNRDLAAEVRAGHFRQDLLYRLDVVHLEIPPLRTRREDLPLLVEHYLSRSREAREKQIVLPEACIELLRGYDFPGNVRELFHVLERAVLLSPGGELTPDDLSGVLRPAAGPQGASPPEEFGEDEPLTLMDSERRHIQRLLAREGGNVSRVSHLLGIDRRTLQRKMKRYGLR